MATCYHDPLFSSFSNLSLTLGRDWPRHAFAFSVETWIKAAADFSFQVYFRDPVVSDCLNVFALGSCFFLFYREKLIVPDFHRIVIEKAFIQNPTLVG